MCYNSNSQDDKYTVNLTLFASEVMLIWDVHIILQSDGDINDITRVLKTASTDL